AWVSYAAPSLAAVVIIFLSRRLLRRKQKLPPGPKPWPIIGNFNLIGPLPHRSLHELAQKYGPLMQIQFGSFPVVVGSSAEMAEAILKTHDISLAGRPNFAAGKYTTYNYSDITWSQYGPYWSQLRRICMTELFSPKRLEQYEHIRVEELKALLKNLYTSDGKPVRTREQFSDVSLNIISRMVLGRKFTVQGGGDDDGDMEIVTPKEFKEMLDELFLLNGVLDIGDWIPWLAFLDLQGNIKRMKAVAKKFDRFIEHVLDEHEERRASVRDYVAKDMMDILLQIAGDTNREDLIAGGTESTAVTAEWALAELLRKPEIFDKATEELDRVIGKERWVEEKDIVNLPYVDAIIKETMRLHNVSPLLVPRLAREDVQIAGYDIPKGTRVMVNVWTIGRDPKLWDKPEEFIPERFIGKKVELQGQNIELIPFGAGQRICVGHPFGLKVIQSNVANLLHGFKWKLPSGMKKEELDMEEVFALSTPKKIPLVALNKNMETPAWVSYAVAFATVALVLLSRYLRRRKLNPPPGPKPWPIIGNLNLIGELPHRSLHELSKKYGPLMQVQFGSFPVVVGSSVEMAKTILKTHDVTFSGRPKTAAGKYTTYNYSDITWSPYGPYWRQARKMCLMELFSAKRLESYEYIRVEELRNLLQNLYTNRGKPINLKDYLSDVSLNVISRMVLGKKYTVKDENSKEIVTPEEFKEMLDELFLLNGVLDIGDSIPWIAFMDLQGYIKRMKALAKKFDRFMEHVLDEHNARRRADKNWVPKDMVDVLLDLADDPSLEIKLERHGVKAFSQGIHLTFS
ncbi:hypothetical protein Tsubulata_033457, partial [Turnera subulata]